MCFIVIELGKVVHFFSLLPLSASRLAMVASFTLLFSLAVPILLPHSLIGARTRLLSSCLADLMMTFFPLHSSHSSHLHPSPFSFFPGRAAAKGLQRQAPTGQVCTPCKPSGVECFRDSAKHMSKCLGVCHPLSPVIRLGLRNPRKKERKYLH